MSNVLNSRYIVGVDINDGKFPLAQQMGAHECVNSITCEGGDVKAWLMGKEKWGYDYTYDCTGNVNVMRCALEVDYPSLLRHHRHHFLILEMILFNPGCSPRLGRVLCDWSGGSREGNLNKAVPAGHWKELEGHSLWRLEVEN